MGRDDPFITAPSFFRCPISLDVMKSPVSLCTGVTYDRSSIQRWLDGGNNTCPATMQVLQNKDIVPNHTLRRLINIWSESVRRRQKPPSNSTEAAAEISAEHQVVRLIEAIKKMPYNCKECLAGIASWGRESEERLRFLASCRGLLPALINILGGRGGRNADLCAEAVKVLDLVGSKYEDKEELTRLVLKGDLDCLSPMLLVLKRGTPESRLACLRFLECIAADAESKLQIAEKDGLVSQLLVLMMPGNNSDTASANEATEACLSCLASISMSKRAKSLVVRVGAVKSLSEILSESSLAASCVEKALKLLEMSSSCREGRSEISDNPKCVPAVVQRVLKVSAAATEHAVTILWSMCYLFRDHKAAEAVAKSNGLTKILLLMQSNCSPEVRRMSGDLLKIFRVGSKSCISSYDTKTTHIMPF